MGIGEPRTSVEDQFNGSVLGLTLTFPFSHTLSSLLFLSFKWFYVLNTHPILNRYTSWPDCSSLPGSFSTFLLYRQLGGIKCYLVMWLLHTVKISLGSSPDSLCHCQVLHRLSDPWFLCSSPAKAPTSPWPWHSVLNFGLLLSFGNTLLS